MTIQEIRNWLKETIAQKPDWLKEQYFKSHFLEQYQVILNFCNNQELQPLSFRQKAWHFQNETTMQPRCVTCRHVVERFNNFFLGYNQYCGRKCSAQSDQTKKNRELTCLEKYGKENVNQIKEIRDKQAKTLQERYGVDVPAKSKVIRQRMKDSCLKRFGVDNAYKAPEIKEKIKQIHLEKRGVDHASKDPEVRDKIKKSNREVYATGEPNLKIKQTCLKEFGVDNFFKSEQFRKNHKVGKESEVERRVRRELGGEKVRYEGREFDIKKDDNLIEVDGNFWHPFKLEDLVLKQIGSVVNDKKKADSVLKKDEYKLYKIYESDIPKNITLENIVEKSYKPDYSLSFKQRIITKEYLIANKHKLTDNISLLLKFIRTFQPEFPFPPTQSSLGDVVGELQSSNYQKIYNSETKTFNNNGSNIGVSYLKSCFRVYWKSGFKGNLSPYDAWYDDSVMKRVIEYRVGLNDSGEVFDFSLYQLIKGLSARRHSISFFKPAVAAAIYEHFLGDKKDPIVIDPCAGFGGRMLGFKALYPDGTYVGIEPNLETFSELQSLAQNFTNVELYNCKLEDYQSSKECDLTFTSIPYFDLEQYNKLDFEYKNFEDWKNTFVTSLSTFKNLTVNLPQGLSDRLGLKPKDTFYLQNKTSHFNHGSSTKHELIVTL